ncbi:MAG: hypothetical protein UH542_08815 [Bacteroidales bacterium]|nr:hypothetical protein [Bacteroidales bacterium]
MVPIGMALCLLLMGFGIFRNMFSGLGFAGENPVKMVLRWFIAGVMVFILDDIFVFCLNNIYMPASNMFQQLPTVSAPSMDFNVGFGALTETILLLVFGIMIITNLFKLAIEIVERYLLCNVLIVFSPLLAASITLETTLKVFQSAVKMVVGQSIIMLLNIVTVKLVTLSFNPLLYDLTNNNRELDHVAKIFIDMVFILALLKIAQRFDNYMRDLGLLVGITGGNLWGDIMAAAHTVGGLLSPVTKGLSKGIKGAIAGGSAASAMTGSKMFSAAKAGGIANAGLNAVNSMAPGGLKNARIASDKNGNTLISGTDKNGNSQIFRMSEMKDGAIDKFKNDKNQQAVIGQNGRAYAVENLTGKAASGSASAMAAEAMATKALNSSKAIPLAGGSTADAHGNVPWRAAASLGTLGTVGGVSLANADKFVPNSEKIGSGNTSEALKDLEGIYGKGSDEITDESIARAAEMKANEIPINEKTMQDSNIVAATGSDMDPLAFAGVDALRAAGMSDEDMSKLSADDLKNMGAYSENGGELTVDNMQDALDTARGLNEIGVSPENVSPEMIAGHHDMTKDGFVPTDEGMANNGEALVNMGKEANIDNMAVMGSINEAGIQASDVTPGMFDGYAEAKAKGNALSNADDIKAAGVLKDKNIPVTDQNISASKNLDNMNISTDENTLAGYNAATALYGDSNNRGYTLASSACCANGIPPTPQNVENMLKCASRSGDYAIGKFYANDAGMTKYSDSLVTQYDSAVSYCASSNVETSNYVHAVVFARNSGQNKPTVTQLNAVNNAFKEAQVSDPSLTWNKFNGSKEGRMARNRIFGQKNS